MKNNNYNTEFVKLGEKAIEEGVKSVFNNEKDIDNIKKLTPDEGYLASIKLIEKDDQKHDRISKSVRIKREITFDKLQVFACILECGAGAALLGATAYGLIKR